MGDVITLKIDKRLRNYSSVLLLNSFCEIDYYNQNIFILKSFFQLDVDDLILILSENFNLKTFIDYIKNK
jgi:hypothetical protein